MSLNSVVVLGAGQGGFQAATSLRDSGFAGAITLVGDEPELPYERPPLSKAYLLGEKQRDGLQLRPENHYTSRNIDLLLGEQAVALDRMGRKITLRSGGTLAYDHLIFATGARNRLLPMAAGLDDVMYVRTLADADALGERVGSAREVVIIGAGFIGLELAAVLRKLGKTTHVLDVMPRVMSRAVSPEMSAFFAEAHAGWGATVVTGAAVAEILAAGKKVVGVRTSDGRTFPADLILVGIGVVPNVELAQAAGLPVDNGIVVDAQLSTPDPAISAIGDCTLFPSAYSAGSIRLESVQNAVDQARCVAARLTGKAAAYASVPWFWSDQADLKLQMVGITTGTDKTVMRGDPGERKFSVFCFRGGDLAGIESVNRSGDHMFGRRLLAARAGITPEQAADLSFDFKAHLAKVTQR
jgi:3-phenylpropionate/trans-cinnamate dioxygenase ferredoxin reductase component